MTAFGVTPRPRGPGLPDRFGRAFPDFDRLAGLPDAMRHEAALLAREAGLAVPAGALAGIAPSPFAIVHDGFAGAAPAMTVKEILAAFVEERIEAAPGAWLPIERARAALHNFCLDKGETTPSDKALLRALIAAFGRPAKAPRGPIGGFPDIAIAGRRP